ncbi:methyl-accepting chemotaxis protein [Dyella sp.]|uniref:methyl-accepting chemotaxis protein n=1 Tax=Dyella sp. TaxID=1869338 RepID=UPI002ED06777
MKISTRITLLLALAVTVALTVGTVGLVALSQTQARLASLYQSNLIPITEVTEIQHLFSTNRTLLNRALLQSTDEGTRYEMDNAAINVQRMNALWDSYYPAQIKDADEKAAAEQFMQSRTAARALQAQVNDLLKARNYGAAKSLMLTKVGPSFEQENVDIAHIVSANKAQAAADFERAQVIKVRTWWFLVATLCLSALGLLAIGAVLARSILKPLLSARHIAARISQGELNHALDVQGRDEVSDTLRSISTMDQQLAQIVRKVRDNAHQVTQTARDISAGADDLSSRTQEQASSLEETAASMEEMTAAVRQNADGAVQAERLAASLRDSALRSHGVASQAVDAMDRITRASEDIADIAVLIDEIAFQTNLLALNAAVEAARAGDEGRGFAVVAGEVRALAQRSASAAREIKGLIQETRSKVQDGARLVRDTGTALGDMESVARHVSSIVTEIAAASDQQSSGITQVNNALASLDMVTQQNAALVEETSAASRQALEFAEDLMKQVAFFTVHSEAGVTRSAPHNEAPGAIVVPGRALAVAKALPAAQSVESGVWQEF